MAKKVLELKKMTGGDVKCKLWINSIPITTKKYKIGQRGNPELWPLLSFFTYFMAIFAVYSIFAKQNAKKRQKRRFFSIILIRTVSIVNVGHFFADLDGPNKFLIADQN